jgi:uncharacterized protein (UPF0332 family)
MSPDELLSLADQLLPFGTEAAFRTVVGRAYYGAFHSAVALINEAGVSLPAGPESHTKVRYCLMESGESSAQEAGRVLHTLRTLRNTADYDLAAAKEFSLPKAQKCLGQARLVLDRLKQCQQGAGGTRFREKVRDYAGNVLRLTVRKHTN